MRPSMILVLLMMVFLVGCSGLDEIQSPELPEESIQTPEEQETPDEIPEEPESPAEVPEESEPGAVASGRLECGGPVNLVCQASWDQGIITSEFTNNLGYDIQVTKLTHYEDEEPWSSITFCETSQDLSIDVPQGGSFTVEIDCSGFDRLDQGFEITYNDKKGYIRIKS